MAKKKIDATVPPAPEPPPPPYVPQTPIAPEARKTLYDEACAYWDEQCEYYGDEEAIKPLNIQARLQAILGAVDLEMANLSFKKAQGAIQMSLLASWSRKDISGPNEPLNWLRKAAKAESLAKMLDSKDDVEGARTQYIRAEECRERAAAAKKEKG